MQRGASPVRRFREFIATRVFMTACYLNILCGLHIAFSRSLFAQRSMAADRWEMLRTRVTMIDFRVGFRSSTSETLLRSNFRDLLYIIQAELSKLR